MIYRTINIYHSSKITDNLAETALKYQISSVHGLLV